MSEAKIGDTQTPMIEDCAQSFDGETMRKAQELHDRTFGNLDQRRAGIMKQIINFFNAASDAYAASLRTDLTERMKTFLPGGHGERACAIFRSVKELLEISDTTEVVRIVERTRMWLEGLGWVVLPRDLKGVSGYKTTAGALKDMIEFESDAIKTRALIAEVIAATKKR